MKKSSHSLEWIVWGGLVVVVVAIFIAFVTSRFRLLPAATQSPPVYGQVSGVVLTNQFGRQMSLRDLRGRVWVADIIFTRCPGPCARMTKTMSQLQGALPAGGSVQLVSLTADPVFDTPEILNNYAMRFGARPENWHFLTGAKKEIYDLAIDELKLSVGEIPPEERKAMDDLFVHSTRFVLVDQQGRVRGFFDGETREAIPKLVDAIDQLSRERTQ